MGSALALTARPACFAQALLSEIIIVRSRENVALHDGIVDVAHQRHIQQHRPLERDHPLVHPEWGRRATSGGVFSSQNNQVVCNRIAHPLVSRCMLQDLQDHPAPQQDVSLPVADASSPLLTSLSRYLRFSTDERMALERLLELNVRTIKAGTTFIEQGSSPSEISIVLSGGACRFKPITPKVRQILAFHLPGDVCDFNALMMEDSDTSMRALVDTRIAAISRDTLNQFSGRFPRISQALWRESLVSAAIQREWMMNICHRNAQQRIAHLLCELVYRLKVGTVGSTGGTYMLPISQRDIGNACSLTIEHTSRTLTQLRRASLASFDKGRLIIDDMSALRNFSGFNPSYLQISEKRASRDGESDSQAVLT